jgi:hypothetical protein
MMERLEDADEDNGLDAIAQSDLLTMTNMAATLQAACNKKIGDYGAGINDVNLIRATLAGHSKDVPLESCGLHRVVQENDHFDTAAAKLIEAYPESGEAQELREVLARARYILSY